MLSFRRIVTGIAIAATAIGTVILAAPSATAETATVKYQCTSIIGGSWWFDWRITIDAPAVATHGQTATLNIAMELVGDPATAPIAAHTNGTSLDISIAGASSSVVTTDPMWNPEIPVGGHIHMSGTVPVLLPNVGNVTYKPVKFVWGMNDNNGTTSGLFCSPRPGFPAPFIDTTRVI